MRFKNLIIIGTSHVAEQSLKEVKNTIKEEKPYVICLELDRKRLYALLTNRKAKFRLSDIKRVGLKGFVFSVIGSYVQKKIGEKLKVIPGQEMKLAIKLARKQNVPLALIDQDIELTLKKLSKRISWKEKINFVLDVLQATFFKKQQIKKFGLENLDLKKVPPEEIIEKLLIEVKERYPNIYYTLVEERNEIMAKNLVSIMTKFPKKPIIVIVGAGHLQGIIKILKEKYLY